LLLSIASAAFDAGLAIVMVLAAVAPQPGAPAALARLGAGVAVALLAASALSGLFASGDYATWLRLGALLAAVPVILDLWQRRSAPQTAEPHVSASSVAGEEARTRDAARMQMLDLLQHALAGSSIIIAQQDRDLRYTRVFNPLPGYEDMVGKTDRDILPPDLLAEIEELKQKVLAEGEPIDTEIETALAIGKRWFKVRIEPTPGEDGLTSIAVDITAEKLNERHLRSLLQELTHRSRNLLAVIQGIARRTAASTHDVDQFVERFGGRLQALAAAHDVLIDRSWRGAALEQLVDVQLSHLGANGPEQLHVEGDTVVLKPEAAQHFALALHELAANAVEHGALSRPGGTIQLSWHASPPVEGEHPNIEFVWREEGGPPVAEPDRSGFGHIVLDRLVPRGLDGRATLEFPPEGVVWRLTFPRSNLLDAEPN
jgi:two-component sensor histidine kinase/PAS domain-containing protein